MQENNKKILDFSKVLAGKFSNESQAYQDPRNFSHINIYFRPIPWFIFKGPGFYSEQSYDFDKWSPYRQGLHRISLQKNIIIVDNFQIKEQHRFAGSGFDSSLLNNLSIDIIKQRIGCSMHFIKVKTDNYQGYVEPGNSCIIDKLGKATYLKSHAKLNDTSLIIRDEGFDLKTHQKVWGSESGDFKCYKVESFSKKLNLRWAIQY